MGEVTGKGKGVGVGKGVGTKQGSLRERKKVRTRAELKAVSSRLFRKQGYEQTTLEQIADGAELSIRTLPRYFESKLQLALADYYEWLAEFRKQIARPDRAEDALTCWQAHLAIGARLLTESRPLSLHLKFVLGEPALAAGMRELYHDYEDALAAGISQDAGVDPGADVYARLLAGMLVAGNWAAIRSWMEGGRRGDLAAAGVAVLDFARASFPARTAPAARRLRLGTAAPRRGQRCATSDSVREMSGDPGGQAPGSS